MQRCLDRYFGEMICTEPRNSDGGFNPDRQGAKPPKNDGVDLQLREQKDEDLSILEITLRSDVGLALIPNSNRQIAVK